ncbi:MAG: hypothetical protein MRZ86_06115 [Acidaminococcus sp.]|nr:hypothetical protein [Acidaminococcus sp.]MDD7398565.1 hypothetical protein [Bacillota bacterium]MDY5345463.1 hypothetical protein [Eubacteriales bacterium]
MEIIFNGITYKFESLNDAIEKAAFEHYPLTIEIDGAKKVVASFDEANDYILNLPKSFSFI